MGACKRLERRRRRRRRRPVDEKGRAAAPVSSGSQSALAFGCFRGCSRSSAKQQKQSAKFLVPVLPFKKKEKKDDACCCRTTPSPAIFKISFRESWPSTGESWDGTCSVRWLIEIISSEFVFYPLHHHHHSGSRGWLGSELLARVCLTRC